MIDKMINKQIGRYKILRSIGEGGMATVYLAEDNNLEREVALKMIRTEMIPPQQLPRLLERFKREAKALAKLSDDPAIVTVHDYGEYEDTPYLVMAYMPGGTLKDMLGKPMDYREAAEMLIPVTRALGEAHAEGIIHRDVKPSNLLVDKRGQLALADFGIAKALEMDGQTLTGTGLGVGTPEYMAPEQWRGEASPQTDVYSLGVVLYEMVTGKKPFKAENPSDIYLKQMTEVPTSPRDLVPRLTGAVEDVLGQAMHREAGSRFADMGAFCEALQGLKVGEMLHEATPTAVPQPGVEPETAQLAVEPMIEQSDVEETFDELATPAEGVEQPAELLEQNEQDAPLVQQVRKPELYQAAEADQQMAVPMEAEQEGKVSSSQKKTTRNSWMIYGGLAAPLIVVVFCVIAAVGGLGRKSSEQKIEPIIEIVEVTTTPNLVGLSSTTDQDVTQEVATQVNSPTSTITRTSTPIPTASLTSEFSGNIAFIRGSYDKFQVYWQVVDEGLEHPFEQISSTIWEYGEKSVEYVDDRFYWKSGQEDLVCTGYCNIHTAGTLISKIGGNYGWGYSVPIGCTLIASDVKCPSHSSSKCTCCDSYFCPDSYTSVSLDGRKYFVEGSAKNYFPIWSPQGDRFAYLSLGQGDVDIIVNGKSITDSIKGEISTPSWSIDGQKIAFAFKKSQSDPRNICYVEIDSQKLSCLTDNSMDEAYPSWAEDGKTIAFSRNDGNDFEIVLIDIESVQEQPITDNEVDDIYPLWSIY